MSLNRNELIGVSVPGMLIPARPSIWARTRANGAHRKYQGRTSRYQRSRRGTKVGSRSAAAATRKAKMP